MCGIVGYIGTKSAVPILVGGLKRLEYRGYDSAGLALVQGNGKMIVHKCKGRVADLEKLLEGKDSSATIGIAHTRWATHGEPNDCNAHPHISQSGRIALVHNGIIENYRILKEALKAQGYSFNSTTDSEVLVNLIEHIQKSNNCTLLEAVQQATKQVIGAYAVVIIDRENPNQLIAIRQSSPLVIGIGNDDYFISSDAASVIEYTHDFIYLNDGEIAIVGRNEPVRITTADNNSCRVDVSKLQLSISQLEKGGHAHFMLKEIFEQPNTLHDCIRGRIDKATYTPVLSGVRDNRKHFLDARRLIIVACGTSWHAALIGKHFIESFCRIPVEVDYASEFRYRNPIIEANDIVIAISQSGETADTLAAVELAHRCGAFVYGICNAVGSSIARATDSGTYIHVGPEIGVASTKAFTGQVTVLLLLALTIGRERGIVPEDRCKQIAKDLLGLPQVLDSALKQVTPEAKSLAKIFTYAHNFIYMGRGVNYPTALEGALKLKEISYIHAEGYPAAEMKHGPIALIDAEMPCVVIATPDSTYDKTVSNMEEIKSRGGKIVAVVAEGDNLAAEIADYVIVVPRVDECLMPIVASIPLQLLAYYIAVNKGRDVDKPRNLAKSVTVE
ncbi:MAG: glutamine--fructose-6-phosphate transaminase (isomerizing) [Tidjanibacter sp.]|nr:glutamine--fructose-6-phosphate transaminase (isomerizing) [Tidjanibacter sp.]